MKRNKLWYTNHKEIDGIIYKYCSNCKRWLPENDEYFYLVNKSKPEKGFNAACKECTKKASHKWNKDNPEKRKIIMNKFDKTKKRKEIINRRKNEIIKYREKWNMENPDWMRTYTHNRRRKLKNNFISLSIEEWEACKEYFNHECVYCGLTEEEHIQKYNEHLHQEHFVPFTKGGDFTKSNIIPSCRICNSSKHNSLFEDWYKNQSFFNLFRYNKILNYTSLMQDERGDIVV